MRAIQRVECAAAVTLSQSAFCGVGMLLLCMCFVGYVSLREHVVGGAYHLLEQ